MKDGLEGMGTVSTTGKLDRSSWTRVKLIETNKAGQNERRNWSRFCYGGISFRFESADWLHSTCQQRDTSRQTDRRKEERFSELDQEMKLQLESVSIWF